MSDVAAIVLAAGLSSRFRAAAGPLGPSTKLVAPHEGEALVRRVVKAALGSRAKPVIVVTGHARAEVEGALNGLAVVFVHNPGFAAGLASSLKTGVAALPADADGALILLGDMPDVSAGLLNQLLDTFARRPGAKAVVPTHAGERGNPVLLGRSLFGEVAKLTGDAGARKLLVSAGADVVDLPIADPAVTYDIDTPNQLKAD